MKRFLSLILTLTMLTTLFVGFSAPVMAENEDVTISIVPDVSIPLYLGAFAPVDDEPPFSVPVFVPSSTPSNIIS